MATRLLPVSFQTHLTNMKQNTHNQVAGLWIDTREAIVVNDSLLRNMHDAAKPEHVKAHQSHNSGSEHSVNQSKKADTHTYFKDIASLLSGHDEIYILGPGKIQEQFQNHLQEDPHFKDATVSIDSAEQISEPLILAKIRDFYHLN